MAEENNAANINAEEGDDYTPSGNWRESLSQELRDAPALKDIKSIEALAKNHIDLQTHLGNMIKKPGEHAGDEDWQKFRDQVIQTDPKMMPKPDLSAQEQAEDFFKSIGKPEQPDGYTIPEVGDEEYSPNEDYAKNMMKKAHSLHLTNQQFQEWFSQEFNSSVEAQKNNKQAIDDAGKTLKEEWGHAFEQNLNEVDHFFNTTKAPDTVKEAFSSGTLSPDIVKYVHDLGIQMMGESNEVTNQHGGARLKTPQQLRQDVVDINNQLDKVQPGTEEARLLGDKLLEVNAKLTRLSSAN